MKVLQLCKFYHPFKGGIELVEEMISKAHTNNGHSVTILSFGEDSSERIGPYGEKVFQLKTHLNIISTPISLKLTPKYVRKLNISQFNIIYVHLHNPLMHELVKYIRFFLRSNQKIIGVYHSDILSKGFLGNLYQKYFRWHAEIYDFHITSSSNLIKSSKVLSTLPKEKVKAIPFCSKGEMNFIQRSQFQNKLLAIGRLVPYKGFNFLINALKETNYNLSIIGSGPEEETLRSINAPNIKLLGRVSNEERNKLIKEASCLILPSMTHAEAYGLVIVEAFEAGLPVIASNLQTGVTFMVRDGETGYTFKTGDKEQLLKAIEKIESNDNNYKHLSTNCRKFYEKHLSFESFKKNLMELL